MAEFEELAVELLGVDVGVSSLDCLLACFLALFSRFFITHCGIGDLSCGVVLEAGLGAGTGVVAGPGVLAAAA